MADPNIVNSGLSKRVTIDNEIFSIEIYRLEDEKVWTLEVVDKEGTSTVWDNPFRSDAEALTYIEKAIEEEGVAAFRDDTNVIPFRR